MLSPYDGISIGILSALKCGGYGTKDKPLPVVTGQDAELASVKSIIAGEQTQTVYKDTRELAKVGRADGRRACSPARSPRSTTPRPTTTATKVVPAYLLEPVSVDKTNYQKVLVDAGYYKAGAAQVTRRPSRIGPGTTMAGPVLEMRSIIKTFPGVKALSDVTSDRRARARSTPSAARTAPGKSTLMKVLSGVHPHGSYEGEILFEGEPCAFKDIRASEQRGIVIIHQELALVPYLSIAENIFLGNEHATRGRHQLERDPAARRRAAAAGRVCDEHPQTRVADIGVGKQQLVEIAKALAKKVKLLILDEPTAALNDEDSGKLLDLILELKSPGHHLHHHLAQAERDPHRSPTRSPSCATGGPSRPST